MMRFKSNSLLCALAIGFGSLIPAAASAQERPAVRTGCHVHGKLHRSTSAKCPCEHAKIVLSLARLLCVLPRFWLH
jgi:hypothetical protein